MLANLYYFNLALFVLFTAFYSYQMFYIGYVLWRDQQTKKRPTLPSDREAKLHRYAFVSSARNESAVIAELIESIKAQRYPAELIDIYIIADNCTDDTADIARQHGAKVYERFNTKLIGKGYALDEFFKYLRHTQPEVHYDGYFVFDADNLLDADYTWEMNKVFDQGYPIVTSYRNSRNYASNWISAGYGLWFLRESKYLSQARMMLGTSCAISGTGFLVSSEVIREQGGWPYHLLTEDIEFSIANILQGRTIGYAAQAVIYDEQPVTFKQSWQQRLRWSKGFYQVLGNYGQRLVTGMFDRALKPFACYDMLMTICPAIFLAVFGIIVNGVMLLVELNSLYVSAQVVNAATQAIGFSCFNFYFMFFVVGLLTTITEWGNIDASSGRKLAYTVTFPLFMMTYIPIAFVAFFKRVEWTPIAHGVAKEKAKAAI